MDRRTFIGVVSFASYAAALAALAQNSVNIRRIGWLDLGAPPSGPLEAFRRSGPLEAFRRGLRELGWIEGRNVAIETRYADDDSARLAVVTAELVALKVDVIVTITTPAAIAAKNATQSIPIVMAGSSSPVELGLVESLARPGHNVTGVTNNPGGGFNQKVLQLFKEAVPNVSRVALLWAGADARGESGFLTELRAAGAALGITVLSAEAREPNQVPVALAAVLQQRPDGLFVTPNSVNTGQRKLIVDFALAKQLPAIFVDSRWVTSGGLMSYGIDWLELRRHTAIYVDKILRGVRPADLPVEQPTKFELVINLKTAKSLGLTIPQTLLVRADEVIQ
jgi:putative ABC transport system substrate-binding protein